jgi:hypothetical protein
MHGFKVKDDCIEIMKMLIILTMDIKVMVINTRLSFPVTLSMGLLGHQLSLRTVLKMYKWLSKSDQEKFPCEYRFEYGTLMRYIYEDMLVKDKNLAEDIFGASGEAQHQVEGPIHIVPG